MLDVVIDYNGLWAHDLTPCLCLIFAIFAKICHVFAIFAVIFYCSYSSLLLLTVFFVNRLRPCLKVLNCRM